MDPLVRLKMKNESSWCRNDRRFIQAWYARFAMVLFLDAPMAQRDGESTGMAILGSDNTR